MSTPLFTLIAIIIAVVAIIAVINLRRKKTGSAGSGKADAVSSNQQVYIGNLAYRVSEDDLRDFFQNYGNVVNTRVVKNSRTGRSKGFGFITYETPKQAKQALSAHGDELQGRRLVVRIAKPRSQD